jgi:hypothetical protein
MDSTNTADLRISSGTKIHLYGGTTNGTTSPHLTVSNNGNVGIGDSNPQHPFKVHLTNGELAMFGSNGMNSPGQYAGIGLGQVLANNTTYQKVAIVAEGRNNGNYVSNLHFLVDTAADSGSAVLADSKMMISGGTGNVGIGTTTPDLTLDVSHATASEYVATFQNTGSNLQLKIGTEPNDGGYLNIQGARVDNGNPYNLSLQSEGSNIGIGTTAPLVKLDVRGSPSAPATSGTAQTGSLRVSQTAGNGVLDMGFYTSATGTAWIQSTNKANLATNYGLTLQPNGGNVGIGTDDPKANLHVNVTGNSDGFLAGGKNLSLNASYQTSAQLEVTLGNHQGCYVKVFITGDWSGHSAMAFLGEYFIQNGADAYAEPGMIIREVENTSGIDSISSRIYDGGAYDSFQIQFKLNVPSGGATSAAGNLTYQIMGQFDAVS